MSTIKATKYFDVNTIADLLEAIEKFGKEQVNTDYVHHFIRRAVNDGINPTQWQQLILTANDSIVSSAITSLFSSDEFMHKFVIAFNTTEADLTSELINIAIQRNLSLGRLPAHTTLEQLNALAEKDLAPLYFVETVEALDVEFVRKYAEHLDLSAVAHRTKDREVHDLAEELDNRNR